MITEDFVAAIRLFKEYGSQLIIDNDRIDVIYSRNASLVDLCISNIARKIISKDSSLTELLGILKSIPNTYLASRVWLRILDIGNIDFRTYWFFFQWLDFDIDIQPKIFKSTVINRSAIFETIRLFNGLDPLKRQKLAIKLFIDYPLQGIEKLSQLNNLVELTYTHPIQEQLQESIRLWISYIKLNPDPWKNLKFLNLPHLKSAKLVYDVLCCLPSLKYIIVGLSTSSVNDIPILKNSLEFIPIENRKSEMSCIEGLLVDCPIKVFLQFHKAFFTDMSWERNCFLYKVAKPVNTSAYNCRSKKKPLKRLKQPRLRNSSSIMSISDALQRF